MTTVPISEVRTKLSDIFDSVVHDHQRVIVERHHKDRIAMIPVEDLERLQAFEDAQDIADADAAMAESGASTSFEEIKKELGL